MRAPVSLEPSLSRQLTLAAPPLRQLVERLQSPEPAARLVAIESVPSFMLEAPRATPTAHAAAAVPFVLALATHPRYPGAASLLQRLTTVLAQVDVPPRSRAGASGTHDERDLYDRFEADVARLVRCGRTSRDPQASRLASCLAARFPAVDPEVEPLLVALLTGAPDADLAAPLLYMLTRVQLARGGAFSNRVASALSLPRDDPGALAVHLALVDADAPLDGIRRRRAEEVLRAAAARERPPVDPRAYGRTLGPEAVDAALALLMK